MHPALAALATSEPWAMDPERCQSLWANLAGTPSAVTIDDDHSAAAPYSVTNGVATVPVRGVLMKRHSPVLAYFGVEHTGYDQISGALAMADRDGSVRSIRLDIDSPGGSVAGLQSLADGMRSVAKPMHARVEDMCASAAYWIAAQADTVSASRGAMVGSIGVYNVVIDRSAQAQASGVKVHVLASGAYKGAGIPGASITADQLADMQATVDRLAGDFVADVAQGRGMTVDQVKPSADGRIFSAAEAKARGLINAVTTMKDEHMKSSLEQAAEIAKVHPKHAAMVIEMAAADASEAAILAKIQSVDAQEVAVAAEAAHKALAADRDALAKERDELKAALAVASAKVEQLSKLGAGAPQNVGADADTAKPRKTADELAALSGKERAAFFRDGGEMI